MENIIIVVALLLLLLLLISNVKRLLWVELKPQQDPIPEHEPGEIPKIIWTFWDSNLISKLVDKCFKTFKQLNPGWSLVILTPGNFREYTEDDVMSYRHAKTPQQIADFIRLAVLDKHGGVWCDASILMTQPLDEWLPKCDYIGFYIDKTTTRREYPVIENWFMACTPHNKFVGAWKKEFNRMNNFTSTREYVNNVKSAGVDIQKIDRNYLTMHVAAQYVMQIHMTPNSITDELRLLKADDGPLKILKTGPVDIDPTTLPMIKFIGSHRDEVDRSRFLSDKFSLD